MSSPVITLDFLKGRPLSKTSLMQFRKSPAHYRHYLTAPKDDTPALVFGRLFDCMVLTPDETEKRFVVMPKFGRKKTDEEAKEEWILANAGKTFVSEEMVKTAEAMKEAVFASERAASYLNVAGQTQRRLTWEDKDTGLPMLSYVDADGTEPVDFIVDLKSAADASEEAFTRDAYKYGYHLQTAIYLEGFRRKLFRFPKFVFVVVEKEPPYGVAVYDKLSDAFLKLGQQELATLREEFLYAMKENLFEKTYDFRTTDGGLLLDLPGWARNKIIE